MVENNKPKVLIENTQEAIQGKQELYKYIKDLKEKSLTINNEQSIENVTEKLNKLNIFVEKFKENTSEHQKLLLDNLEESDESRINSKYDIQSETRLIIEKMDKVSEAHSNIPKLSTPFSHIRRPIKLKEKLRNPFITYLGPQDNNQFLMKEATHLENWPALTGEGEYYHMSFIKTIDILQKD
ncbi:hypothetical protein O181_003051 [Austropuccinia psidii MF-1]|uniref:Uncharacterized protein n=1 Tax=Austropuccinia psidii MF-1 TaxID=1389203 RepID=A0A9Q3BD31_9BASI|nr:hypothetical protein [Austropuccinia psidii MF-1]